MQAALRRTSDCLFSMRSYRVSCTRTSRSRTLFPVPLPPWLLLPFCSPLRPCQTAAVAPSHQLTLPFLCTGAQRRASPHRCSHRSSTFLALSIRSLFTGSTLSLLSHALCAPPSLSLSLFLSSLPILPTTIVLFLSCDDERARISARSPFLPYGRLIICSSMKRRKCACTPAWDLNIAGVGSCI